MRRIFSKTKFWIVSLLKLKRHFLVEGMSLRIPLGHMAPRYYKKYPKYDKFLPRLAAHVSVPNGIVIEVGANVGYCLAKMVTQAPELQYICIEAHLDTHVLLKENTEEILRHHPGLQVRLVNAFIGTEVNNVELGSFHGSNYAKPGDGNIQSTKLDDVFAAQDLQGANVCLIVSDVDGFDWDVIRSGQNLLRGFPVLYFESYMNTEERVLKYLSLIESLFELGYEAAAFFDNYGNYLCASSDRCQIQDILMYSARQYIDRHPKTVFYYDICMYTAKTAPAVMAAISEY